MDVILYTDCMRLPHKFALPLVSLIVLVVPVSPNFQLRQLNIGNSGGNQAESDNFQAETSFGELGGPMSGTSFNGGIGFGFTQMANVPPAPTLTNPNHYYNKLHLALDDGDNPSDTLFAVAISDDSFATSRFVAPDHGLVDTLQYSHYQTYGDWGGGSGFDILGLEPGTTYAVKVRAMQGNFTESGYGPAATAATEHPQLSFDIDISATDTSTNPPYTLNLGTLLTNTVTTGADKIWLSLETNGESGATVYGVSQHEGLLSQSTSYKIDAVTGNLATLDEGFGLQGDSVGQASGGPLTIESPFNGSDDAIGQVPSTYVKILTSSGPLSQGRSSLLLKAKASLEAPAKSDFSELLTLVAAAGF